MAENKEVKETKEKKEKTVKIMIPKTKPNQSAEFISVNERTWLIKPGEYVEVPEYVAVLIENANAEKMKQMAREESKTK